MKKRVLVIGDAVVSTGFARMNHAYIDGLIRADYDVHVLAINYAGDPHEYNYPIYPCRTYEGGDAFGLFRTKALVEKLRPDVVSLTQDPWNVQDYLRRIGNTPVVCSVAVDGKNCRGNELNGASHVVFWTEFGRREAMQGGFTGNSSVIPLGVDVEVFSPVADKKEARKSIGLPESVKDAFIVGVVGRNQPRKRLDLTLMYFAEWIKTCGRTDAYLFLHVAPTGDAGYDLKQLASYLGISNRIIISEPHIGLGINLKALRTVYGCFDVMLTTTQGEGWGLCQMEGMACGIPQIVPNWAALGEWPGEAVFRVPCTSVICTPNQINAVGGIADRDRTIEALDELYEEPVLRLDLSTAGLKLVSDPKFSWTSIGDAYAEVIAGVQVHRPLVAIGGSGGS